MANLVGVPIIIAMILGILFPYSAILLTPYGILLLFLLMLVAGLTIDWRALRGSKKRVPSLALGTFLLFVFFPLLQWPLARLLVSDEQFFYGLVFASLCPVAIVAPYFSLLVEADEHLSFLLVVVSMLVCPVAVPVLLHLLSDTAVALDVLPLIKNMVFLVTVPLFLSFLISRLLPAVNRLIRPHLGTLNIGLLSILVFILFGTAVAKLSINYYTLNELPGLLLMAFVQDFGVFLAARLILRRMFDLETANALAISLSMKNVAIAAGILLFFDPIASFPATLGFVAHAAFFNFISLFRRSAIFRTARTPGVSSR